MSKLRVALLVGNSSGYGRSILAGISRYLRARCDWSVFFAQRDLAAGLPSWVHAWQGDGVIAKDMPHALVDSLNARAISLVDLLGLAKPYECTTIVADDALIAQKAAEHFLDRGYTRFAFCGYQNAYWSEQRCHAFIDYLR
ncbi:MAG: hypothetical protein P8N76_17430 [Pirellulaceae bacterium]|nr:hypothetical protein [Pirellulaceae bacterium]